jgi:UDP-glucose 4-epimerase
MTHGATRGRAIVTGGAGFVGSHVVDRLLAEGVEVLVVDDLSTGSEANLPATVRFERRDIATAELDGLFRDWRPGSVYHLAAQASVPLSEADPLRDLAINVVGTHRVATAARDAGATKLIFVSSGGAIYGETSRAATTRTLPAPRSHYGVHKLAAEGHVRLAGLPYAIARPSNIYGPRQSPGLEGAVVAAFLDQARRTGGLTIHGDGGQTRDFVHVRDVVEALWLIGGLDEPAGVWNVSSGRRTTVLDLAAIVERVAGRPLVRAMADRRAGDVRDSAISSGGLRRLGWRPAVGLEAGIRELAELDD